MEEEVSTTLNLGEDGKDKDDTVDHREDQKIPIVSPDAIQNKDHKNGITLGYY